MMLASVRLYLDTNVLAGVEERAEQLALGTWLRARQHRPVVTDVHLVEAMAIRDAATRDVRLDHLVTLRAGGPYLMPVGFLLAKEYVAEVKRRRPRWIEPIPRTEVVQRFLRDARGRWRAASGDRTALPAFANYAAVAEPAIQVSRSAQKWIRERQRQGDDALPGLVIGNVLYSPTQPVRRSDRDTGFRISATETWYAALYEREESVRDLADYARPFLRRGISEAAFVKFWLSDVDPRELPRALSRHVIAEEQLRVRPTHGNTQDVNHATYAIDADLFITADKDFFNALRAVPAVIPNCASAVLVDRGASSIVRQLEELA
jgi:hypothetical protein